MNYKKYFVFFIVALFVLNGCGVPRTSTPSPDQPPQQEPVVEAVVEAEPVIKDPKSGEFERVRRVILERGIRNPILRFEEFLELGVGESITVDWFGWGREAHVGVLFKTAGQPQWHSVRVVIDRKEYYPRLVNRRTDGYQVYTFDGVPAPGAYKDYVLAIVRPNATEEERRQVRFRFPQSRVILHGEGVVPIMEGDVVFVIEREDIVY